MERIIVQIEKFKANDGKVFDTQDDCIHYEKLVSGTRKVCTTCDGKKKLPNEDGWAFITCGSCQGKGWLEQKVLWC